MSIKCTAARPSELASFTDAAGRLAGLAGLLFGWRPAEFWAATPAELGALVAAAAGEADPLPPDAALIAQLQEQFPDG